MPRKTKAQIAAIKREAQKKQANCSAYDDCNSAEVTEEDYQREDWDSEDTSDGCGHRVELLPATESEFVSDFWEYCSVCSTVSDSGSELSAYASDEDSDIAEINSMRKPCELSHCEDVWPSFNEDTASFLRDLSIPSTAFDDSVNWSYDDAFAPCSPSAELHDSRQADSLGETGSVPNTISRTPNLSNGTGKPIDIHC